LRRSRRFWTYLVLVLPVAVLFTWVVFYPGVYTPGEMWAMVREAGSDGFDWEAGVDNPKGSPIPIPYLIGVPRESVGGGA
jgi:hypothetical protein